MKKLQAYWGVFLPISIFFSILLLPLWVNCSGTRPDSIGVITKRLSPCPTTPNCVSTFSSDPQHKITPISYSNMSIQEARENLIHSINLMKRAKIIHTNEIYIYAEFTSGFWRFVDDVEFLFDDEKKIIHFRSASRLGKSDLGVNRKRMEQIRKHFNSLQKG